MKNITTLILCLLFSLTLQAQVKVGADFIEDWKDLCANQRVGLVVNQTSVLLQTNEHLLDAFVREGINVRKVFAPEHGFRGNIGAGVKVQSSIDEKTGIKIVSLYGKHFKPTSEDLTDIDILVYDIQDVGCRFYTYISTLHYVMEAAAENHKQLIVLDRPNLNDYVDGPIRQPKFKSFVGVAPLPIVYGLTIAELATMINGEGWLLSGKNTCDLTIVKLDGWKHGDSWECTIPPSPNLNTAEAIQWYPSLCLFEGTNISVGRGTLSPFRMLGGLDSTYGDFCFVPRPIEGMELKPLHNGKKCYGVDLRKTVPTKEFSLKYLLQFYKLSSDKSTFFQYANLFDKLAGTDALRSAIIAGKTEEEIRASWQTELNDYKQKRQKYLLYE